MYLEPEDTIVQKSAVHYSHGDRMTLIDVAIFRYLTIFYLLFGVFQPVQND